MIAASSDAPSSSEKFAKLFHSHHEEEEDRIYEKHFESLGVAGGADEEGQGQEQQQQQQQQPTGNDQIVKIGGGRILLSTRNVGSIFTKNITMQRDDHDAHEQAEEILLVKIILTKEGESYLEETGASEFQKMVRARTSKFKQADSPTKLYSKLSQPEIMLFLVTDGFFGLSCAFLIVSFLRILLFKIVPWIRLHFYLKSRMSLAIFSSSTSGPTSQPRTQNLYKANRKNDLMYTIVFTKIIPILVALVVLSAMYSHVSKYIQYDGDERVTMTEMFVDKEDQEIMPQEQSSTTKPEKIISEHIFSFFYDLTHVEAIYLISSSLIGFVVIAGYLVYYRVIYVWFVCGGNPLDLPRSAENAETLLANHKAECIGDVIGDEGADAVVELLRPVQEK